MKKLTTTIFAILMAMGLHSQAFETGRSYISVGYGFGNFTQAVIKAAVGEQDLKYSSFGPAFFKYGYAVSDKVEIGVNIANLNAKVSATSSYTDANSQTVNYTETVKFTTTSVLGRLNFHFGESATVDPYFGVGLGYRSAKWNYTSSDPNSPQNQNLKSLSPFGMEITFGSRFLFTENFGAYAEVGIAKAVFQVGLVAKL